jgi:hypothetical protein
MTDERSEAERDEEAIEHLKAQLTSANAEIWRLKRDRNDHHYATDHLAANAATIAAQAAEIERLKGACVKQNHEIEQTLGKALGYPPFPAEFDAGDQVCVGEHVAESLADEAAKKLAALRSQLKEQRAKTIDVLEEADDYVSCTPYNERPEESNQLVREELEKAAELARSFLIYAQNGHYGPDNSGLELIKQIAAISAKSDEQTPTTTEPSQ